MRRDLGLIAANARRLDANEWGISGVYELSVSCSDCRWTGRITLPKGRKLDKGYCPVCGCTDCLQPRRAINRNPLGYPLYKVAEND